MQRKLNEFMNSDFTNELNGTNQCVTEIQNILLETSKKVLKLKRANEEEKLLTLLE